MTTKKKALGRGLSAILESPDTDITSRDISGNYVVGAIANISLDKIEVNPFQPRSDFDTDALKNLAKSIAEQGIIQPITVRKLGHDKYQLITGERRLKAAHIAGLSDIPTFIRIANDEQMLEMSLVENIQRENLNPIEIAISYQRLIDECHITEEKLSKKVGKDRSTVANFLRLLKLPPEIQIALRDKKITAGHARAIINIKNPETQINIFKDIIAEGFSVRKVEEIVRKLNNKPTDKKKNKAFQLPHKYEILKERLSNKLGIKINLKTNNKGKGNIVIPFKCYEDLEKIISVIEK